MISGMNLFSTSRSACSLPMIRLLSLSVSQLIVAKLQGSVVTEINPLVLRFLGTEKYIGAWIICGKITRI
jgi:hypothetical protein